MINEGDYLSISLAIAALVWLGLWIDTRPLRKFLPGPVVVIVGAGVLSNAGVIPIKSSLYAGVSAYLVPLAIPLLLFKANLRTLFHEAGGVLGIFLLASVATIVGVCIAYVLVDLGDEAAKLAGVYTGAWIGGTMNMVAVSEAVEMTKATSAVAISVGGPLSVVGLLTLMTLSTVPMVRRFCRSDSVTPLPTEPIANTASDQASQWPPFQPTHIFGALVAALALCVASKLIAHSVGADKFAILLITLLTVASVNIRPSFFADLRGAFELGMLFMYIFFAAIGASTDMEVFIKYASTLAVFGSFAIASHIVLMLLATRFLKLRLEEVVIASSAAIVGPAATAAMASARGWRHLVTPGVLCGVFGYVIANFAGVLIANLLP
ncbi:MAG: DUF819 family protein [Pseudomonadota bacterium]